MKKFLSLALTVILLISILMVDVGAHAVDFVYEINKKTKKPTDVIDYEATLNQYLTLEFATPEEKLETMDMMLEKDGYQLWVDDLTGEVATKNLASGQILFSNPYDIGATYKKSGTAPSASTKKHIFSQLIIRYDDNGTDKTMYSFEESAMRGQIKVKNIKNGIRVEYSVGREETRMLVPKVIRKEAFEANILDVFAEEVNSISRDMGLIEINWRDYMQPISKRNQACTDTGNNLWFNFFKLVAYYQLKAQSEQKTEKEKISLQAAYPITSKMDVYVFSTDSTQTETINIENYIKTYVTTYTYEQLEKDHAETNYQGSDKNPALFKLSLEYMLDSWGMSVRLPANGLRFNETLYKLNYLSVLPYMGAGANYLLGDTTEKFTGYNFFPDGSGTLFRHEDLAGTSTTTINAKVYGFDFAYNQITGNHTEVVRYPVFGIVSNYHDKRTRTEQQVVTEAVIDPVTKEVISEAEYEDVDVEYTYNEDRGFVAIIEEGDALAELSTYHEGALSKYNSINMLFYPRPKDSYNLHNAISVASNATWTVVSSRKYVGNYKIRYIMLTDEEKAKENKIENYYEVSWMGMAQAYRDYLYSTGELVALEEKDVNEDIPVYIETFGATETMKKILSIPVNVMTPLTSFDDIKTMYEDLSADGVKNIKFKLTGYANGGMFASVPYKLKWEDAVGGDKGYTNLLDYANDKGFQVFPDFDFAYVRANTDTLFDGLTIKEHVVKSINNTYMSRRYYSATRQTMIGRYELAISAAYYSHFYEKLTGNLLKFYKEGNRSTISIASLGSALNSDFDEDEPYNREDSKKSTIKALAALSDSFDDVMTENGNAYTWKYVDYIINLPLDSSRYTRSSNSVPFIGVLLHGSKQFSGAPLNMEGNIGYSILKAIENGAGLYFVLCYQNYSVLKESNVLSQYYSVRYDILKDDVVKYYKIVNDLTKDLQTSLITSHEFLIGERVPDADELERDLKETAEKLAKELEEAERLAEEEKRKSLHDGRLDAEGNSKKALENIISSYNDAIGYNKGSVTVAANGSVSVILGMQTILDRVLACKDTKQANDKVLEEKTADKDLKEAILKVWSEVLNPYNAYLNSGKLGVYSTLKKALETTTKTYNTKVEDMDSRLETLKSALEDAIKKDAEAVPGLINAYHEAVAKAAESSAFADEEAAALAEVVRYAGSLEDAERYAELVKIIASDGLDIKALEEAYKESAEYASLNTASIEAGAALVAANAADSALIKKYTALANGTETGTEAEVETAKAYIAAKKVLDDANDALTKRISVLRNIIKNCETEEETCPTDCNVYTDLIAVHSSAIEELARAEDDTDTAYQYRADVISAQAAVDAFFTESAAAKKTSEEAKEKLDKYIEEYVETVKATAEYKTAAKKEEDDKAELAALEEKFKVVSPSKQLYDQYMAAANERVSRTDEKNVLENGYLSTDKYKELKKALDIADGELTQVQADLLADMENDSQYQKLKKAYDDAKAELEKYTLGYKDEEKYQRLEAKLEKAQAAVDEFAFAYENDETYKTLKAADDKAEEAFEKANKVIDDIINGKATSDITTAQLNALTAAVEEKAKTNTALKEYMDDFTKELNKNADYKAAVKERDTIQKDVDSYIKVFQSALDIEAKDAQKADNKEELDAYKYSVANDAFKKAETTLSYFVGSTAVPSTVKDALVYSKLVLEKTEYKNAETKKKNAQTAVDVYISQYKGDVKTTNSSAIVDKSLLALNEQYLAADTAYKAANDEVVAITTDLRKLSPTLNSSLSSYFSNANTLLSNKNNMMVAEGNFNACGVTEDYNKAMTSYQPVADEYDKAAAAFDASSSEFVLANDAAGKATTAQTKAVKELRDQITKINSSMKKINSSVGTIRRSLNDSDYAMEVIGSSNEYSQVLKDELKVSNAEVKKVHEEAKEYTEKAIAAAKEALAIANGVIPTDTEIANPFEDAAEDEKTEEGEETEEEEKYEYTKYTDDSGNIIRVAYSNGVVFFLNYNYFAVTTVYGEVTYELPAYGGVRVNADGTSAAFTATLETAAE